jgi:enoyl-CoA hydratase/carnithine racemase
MPSTIERLSDVSVERIDGGIAFIRIDLGTPANAVTPKTMRQLCGVFDEVEADRQIRAIILGHAGRHFVGGADFAFLEELKTATPEQIREGIYAHFQGAVRRFHHCSKPTIAAIGGAAVTVGCEAAIACDFRIVTEQALFQESWIKLGLMPPLGGLKKLPALIGYGRAADMVLRGRPVRGAEAVAIGLAHKLVAQDALDAEAIAAAAPQAYAAAKKGLLLGLEQDFEETFAASVRTQAGLIQSRDFREGVDAVVEKRPARFSGE